MNRRPETPAASAAPDLFGGEPDEGDNTLIPEDELETGWMSDDPLAETDAPADSGALSNSGFFERLGTTADEPRTPDEPDDATATHDSGALSDTDFFQRLQMNADANVLADNQAETGSSSEFALSDEDLANALRFDEDLAAQADVFGQWEAQAQTPEAAGSEAPEEDDFLAALNASDDILADTPANADDFSSLGLYDEPAAETSETSEEDELFAPWGTQTEAQPEDDLYGQWETESPEQAQTEEQADSEQPEADDLYAGLNLYDEPAAEQPAAQAEEQDLYGQWEAQSPEQSQADERTAR